MKSFSCSCGNTVYFVNSRCVACNGELDSARHGGPGEQLNPCTADLQAMIDRFVGLGVVLNEMNRAMGLIDLVPDIIAGPIVTRPSLVHDLLRASALPRASVAV